MKSTSNKPLLCHARHATAAVGLMAVASLAACGGATAPPSQTASKPAPAVSPSAAPPASVRLQSSFTGLDLPEVIDVYQGVLDFRPGAWTPFHTHPGPAPVVVVSGEITMAQAGQETKLQAGATAVEPPGVVHRAGNLSGAPARVLYAVMAPQGGDASAAQPPEGSPPPGADRPVPQAKLAGLSKADAASLDMMILDVPAGSSLTNQPGRQLNTLLDGELTLQADGTQRVMKPGDTWASDDAHPAKAANGASTPASVFVSVLRAA